MRRLCPLVLLAACTGTTAIEPTDSDSDVASCDEPVSYYVDDDYDGYGVTSTLIESCRDPGDGFTTRDGDCDDLDDDTFPGAIEGCDGVDRDCDGSIDNDVIDAPEWRPDADGDGFADARPGSGVRQCDAPDGYAHSSTATDCDDTSPLAYPGADDPPCDGIDQDCSGEGEFDVAQIEGVTFGTLNQALLAADGTATVVACSGDHSVTPTVHANGLHVRGVGADPIVIKAVEGRIFQVSGPSLTLQNLTLSGGRVLGADGGAVFAQVARVSLTDVELLDNSADGSGGAVYVVLDPEPGSEITVERLVARDNTASADGGVIAVVLGGTSFITARDWLLVDNRAGGNGGALWVTGVGSEQEIVMDDVIAFDNHAGQAGGTMSLVGARNAVLVGRNVEMRGGSAERGGHLSLQAPQDGKIDLQSSIFEGASATLGGGLIYQQSWRTLDSGLADTELSDGQAPQGGLYWLELRNTAHLDWLRADLTQGIADQGAAVYLTGEVQSFDGVLDAVLLQDNEGSPAFEVDPDFTVYITASLNLTASSILNNAQGGLSVPRSVSMTAKTTNMGSGDQDNGEFDLEQGGRTHQWSGVVNVECVGGACTD